MCVCGSNAPEFAHVFLAANGIGAAVTIANGQLTSSKVSCRRDMAEIQPIRRKTPNSQ